LHDLDTIYDLEDAYNLYEIIAVDAYNDKQQSDIQNTRNNE